jgi:tetratricopeptide (TPR) repeat protein
LETDPLKKAKLYKKLAQELKAKGSYGKARQYYNEALKLNPSDGSPYLSIAAMYAKSANSCGDTNFNKRAVFWLAALEAEKAGRVDGRLKKAAAQTAASYRASAPSKSDIFSASNSGEVIKIGCWIGRSVTVPNI